MPALREDASLRKVRLQFGRVMCQPLYSPEGKEGTRRKRCVPSSRVKDARRVVRSAHLESSQG